MVQNKKVDNFKLASGIFVDFKNTLSQLLKTNPEIVEDAIRKRNTQIKCLKADIEHRQVVFKEMNERYDAIQNENEELKNKLDFYKQKYEYEKNEKEKVIISLSNNNKIYTQKQNEYVFLKRQMQVLENENKIIKNQLDDSKTHIAIELNEKKKNISYRLNVLADKLPEGIIKMVIKFLLSKQSINYTYFFIFILLIMTSLFGWGPIISFIKQITTIF
jgi:hypothetical protein